MTIDIRDTLHDVGASVAPPAIDHEVFDDRVRGARHRRRLVRAAVATAGLAAVGVAAWLVAPGDAGQADLVTDQPTATAPATSPDVLAFAQQDRLFLSTPDSPMVGVDTGLGVEEIVARVPGGVVFVDLDSHLKRVDVHPDGTIGQPTDVGGPEPVQWAGVDASRTTLWFVDLDDVLHRRDLGSATDLATSRLPRDAMVWAVGADRWVSWQPDKLQLHTDAASYDVEPYFRASTVGLAGTTMAVVTDDGTEIWSAVTGKRLHGSLGGSTAALSTDGRWVASAPNDADLDLGMDHGLWLVDTAAGRVHDVRFGDDTGPVGDIWWADEERFFVVVDTNAGGQPVHTLYECTVGSGACQTRIEDETGTLQLPRD